MLGLLDLSIENNNFYFRKYRPDLIFFGDQFGEQAQYFIERYLDGKEKMHYQSEERTAEHSKVTVINSDQLENLVVKNPNIKQCVIEVFKHDCPACAYNGRMFDIISQKF